MSDDGKKPEREEPAAPAAEHAESSPGEPEVPEIDAEMQAALDEVDLPSTLAPPPGSVAPNLLDGVQRELRDGSRGKSYGDGGDESAFNELVATYERRVFALAFRMLGRRDEAEDLAQEVFVQVFRTIDQFRGDSKLSTWIYRIAVDLCKDRATYLSRRAAGMSRPDELVGAQRERAVKKAITHLEPELREVLVLRDVEDLSYEEIASATGLPDGTVKSRIRRARAELRALVEKVMGEEVRGH
jgi:RNA polymerase sigma-70 factor (ECF subfamily)